MNLKVVLICTSLIARDDKFSPFEDAVYVQVHFSNESLLFFVVVVVFYFFEFFIYSGY